MKKYILLMVVLVSVFVFLLYLSTQRGNKETNPKPSAIPIATSQPTALPEGALPNSYTGDKKIEEENQRSYVVGQLINKLPHQETHLLLSYDINKNIFTATIDSSDKNKGLAQLDAVLKINGIESRSWIENLEIVYK